MSWSTGTGTETPGTVDSPVVGGGGGGDSGGGDSATNSPIRTAVRGAKNPQRASHSNALARSQGSGARDEDDADDTLSRAEQWLCVRNICRPWTQLVDVAPPSFVREVVMKFNGQAAVL